MNVGRLPTRGRRFDNRKENYVGIDYIVFWNVQYIRASYAVLFIIAWSEFWSSNP